MMDTFKFLEKYDKDSFICARDMEKTLLKEPLSALTLGGRFLEAIRNALYRYHYKDLKKYNKNFSKDSQSDNYTISSSDFKREDLSKHISDLYHSKLIKASDSSKIIAAYNIRHNIHLNNSNDIEADKKAAKELYKEVFEIAVWFCKHVDSSFDDSGLEFKYPEKDVRQFIPDVTITNLFDNCIVCGNRNISSNSNLCPECKRKIRIASDLEDLLDIMEGVSFTRDFLKAHSYDKYEIDYLIHFIREFELVSSETKGEFYLKNKSILYNFIDEMKTYEYMEKILIAFYNELISANEIDCSENSPYMMGKNGTDVYKRFYELIVDRKVLHYLNLKQLKKKNGNDKVELKDLNKSAELKEASLTIDEIADWYDNKIKLIIKTDYKNNDDAFFVQISAILMETFIAYRQNGYSNDEIASQMELSDEIMEFWFSKNIRVTNNYPFVKEFIFKNREITMRLFSDSIKNNKTKEEAMDIAGADIEFVNKYFDIRNEDALRRNWRLTKQNSNEQSFNTFKNVYFNKRSNDFITYLKYHSIDYSLENSLLSFDDFNNWYVIGKKDFLEKNDTEFARLYKRITKIFMDKFLSKKRDGLDDKKICEEIGLDYEYSDYWFELRGRNYKLFDDFFLEYDKIIMGNFMESIENGLDKTSSAMEAGVSLEYIDFLSNLGKSYVGMDDLEDDLKFYMNFYNDLNETYAFKSEERFFEYFKKSRDYEKSLKRAELNKEDFENRYNLGKEGNEEYKEFYEKLLDLKLQAYASVLNKNNNKNKALKKSGLSKREVVEFSEDLDTLKLIHTLCDVVGLSSNKKIDFVAKKLSIRVQTIFDWYLKGRDLALNSDFEYLEIEDLFDENHKLNGFDYFNSVVPYTQHDENEYLKLFYNLYNELYVKTRCEIISDVYPGDEKLLKQLLRKLKVSNAEYKLWDSLGLIDKTGEIKLEEMDDLDLDKFSNDNLPLLK